MKENQKNGFRSGLFCFDFKINYISISFYSAIKILQTKMDFEANYFVSISKSVKFPYIAQLNYCNKLDFEADYFFRFQNQLNFLI